MSSPRASHAPGRARLPGGEAGFTVVEVLVAILILVIGILGTLAMLDTANGTSLANRARTVGVNLARQVAEGSRAIGDNVPYSHLSDGCPSPSSPANPCSDSSAIVTALKAQPGLAPDPGSPAGTWSIKREGITYTVAVAVCAMDDPSDGSGIHAGGGPFCSDAGPEGSSDNAPDDYKRVTVSTRWSGTRGSGEARSVTLLGSDGSNGPAVTCLRPTAGNCPVSSAPLIDSPATTSLPFTATVSGAATRVVWYVDGAFRGTVTPSGGTATFTWELGSVGAAGQVFDGSYEVSATAFDASGKSGTTGSIQVQVNRRSPVAPGGFLAGRNTMIGGNGTIGGVDLEWLPVPDKDVLYYRIYRQAGSTTPVLLQQTSNRGVTSYTDRTPPANPTAWTSPCSNPPQAASSVLRYWLVAVDQSGSSSREGTATAKVDVNPCNTPPANPSASALSLTNNSDGTLTLSGFLPSPGDADAGDAISAVRIYRWTGSSGPSDPGDRLAYVPTAGGGGFKYTDGAPRPGGLTGRYCFTAVDKRMQESSCSNVVSG